MPGLFGIYEMSRRSLQAYQAAINTAGHNVANASTPGFHRQRVNLDATAPIADLYGAIGTGVTVSALQRIENRFLEQGIQRERPVLASFGARAGALMQAETAFGEPSEGGLTSLLDDFYNSWDDLASNPEDSGVRESVLQAGVTIADGIRSARGRLQAQQDSLNGEIGATLDDANRILRQLADLNGNIKINENAGVISGDLEDRRDLLIETLADLVGASATIADDGTATVRLAERIVVQGEEVQPIGFDLQQAHDLTIQGRTMRAEEAGGRIGGLFQARDQDIGRAIERLDAFAARFAADVNAIHGRGADRFGQPAGLFFTLTGVGEDGVHGAAGVLTVSADLRADPSRVAAGDRAAPGENGVALDIAALRNRSDGASGMLKGLIVDLSSRSREAQDVYEGQAIVVDSLMAQRESISGVSLDEEAANLLRFQRSYEAAARVLTIADELTQTVLQL